MENTFEIGRTYETRSLCDYKCIYSVKVIAKTSKTVTIISMGKESRCKVHEHNGEQFIYPNGRYSMCPIITA